MSVLGKIQSKARLNQKAGIFLSCFIIAVIFWVFTALSRPTETIISIPVSYRNIPFTGKLDGSLPAELNFTFRGTGFELARVHMRQRPDSIVVDVSSVIKNKDRFELQTLSLREQFPGDKLASKVFPETISRGFTMRSAKKVPVILVSQVNYRKRYGAAGRPVVKPDSIEIAGTPEALSKIQSVKTEFVRVEDLASNKFGSVYLTRQMKGITAAEKYVYYYFPVEEYTEGMVEIPVELPLSQRNKVTLLPQKVKVTFMAPLKVYQFIETSDFQAMANIPRNSSAGQLSIALRRQPAGIRQVRLDPEAVDYIIYE